MDRTGRTAMSMRTIPRAASFWLEYTADGEGRVLAVGARHQGAVALHLAEQGEDLLEQGPAAAVVVEQADVALGEGLHVADGLVGGAPDVDLHPAGEQALDDDHAAAPPLVDHRDVAEDQLLELGVGVVARRGVGTGDRLERRRLEVVLEAEQAGDGRLEPGRGDEDEVVAADVVGVVEDAC